MSLNLHYL